LLTGAIIRARAELVNFTGWGMWSFRQWRRRRALKRARLDERQWRRVLPRAAVTRHLAADDLARLRDLVMLFLDEKAIEAAEGVELDDDMRLLIAIQACVPILNLGLDYYDGWHAVIVYPGQFRPRHEYVDDAEVVHVDEEWKSGESWQHGPVILSWDDVRASGTGDGFNVVIHEFAHKLDMLDGGVNGAPPLHAGMERVRWAEAFSAAYEDLCRRVDAGEETAIDPYATEGPEEFFAVVSEAFFEIPQVLTREYPAVYDQLRQFYRQDPGRGAGSA
jgi:Mlc titration factor MtfA (ptsG expression regulator)